jgi:ferredoxin
VAIGMQRTEEVDANISYFENRKVPEDTAKGLEKYKRDLIIQSWCQACGNCIKRCNQGALEIVEGKAVVNKEKCVLCGYCGSVCRELAIKII